MNQPPTAGMPQGPQITPEMVRNAKTLECSCGGKIFQNALVIKRVSAILSPTSEELDIPVQVFVCMACDKVLPETDLENVLPADVKSAPKEGLGDKLIK